MAAFAWKADVRVDQFQRNLGSAFGHNRTFRARNCKITLFRDHRLNGSLVKADAIQRIQHEDNDVDWHSGSHATLEHLNWLDGSSLVIAEVPMKVPQADPASS